MKISVATPSRWGSLSSFSQRSIEAFPAPNLTLILSYIYVIDISLPAQLSKIMMPYLWVIGEIKKLESNEETRAIDLQREM